MTQVDSKRDLVHSVELCQQSIYEDDGPSEIDMPYLVNLQEIDKSSSVDSISTPYQQDNEYSSVTSHDSPNLFSASGQDVGDVMDLDHETISSYQMVVIPDDQLDSPTPERSLAISPPNAAKPSLSSKRKQPLVHHPKDCPDASAWTGDPTLQATINDRSRACEASQAIVSDLNKKRLRSKEELEEMELVIRTSVLSLLSANRSRKTSPQDSPCRESKDPEKQFQCRFCPKQKKTQCDLTYESRSAFVKFDEPKVTTRHANMDSKHHKRHTRPYGCTFTKCPRRFGSKNDWKRHENTMHYQVEAWKCAEPKIPDGLHSTTAGGKTITIAKQCGRLCYRRELFMTHLHEAHGLAGSDKEEYVKDQCKKRRVGRNGQCGFWCGFCQTVVRLEKMGIEAWDERFNHIDDEHFKQGDRVEDWVPLEGEVPRGLAGMVEMIGGTDADKGAREEEEKGSDEEDSGPDAEGEVVMREKVGVEEKRVEEKRAKEKKVDVEARVKSSSVRRQWSCVRAFSLFRSCVLPLSSHPTWPFKIPLPIFFPFPSLFSFH